MNARLERREGWPPRLPEMFDWLESGFPALPGFGPRGSGGAHALRIEERVEAGAYTLSVELPGVDPDKDVEISVDGDILTVRAERGESAKDKQRSEFRYGAFARSVQLPAGARSDDATASYESGILTIRVPIEEAQRSARTIPVKSGGA